MSRPGVEATEIQPEPVGATPVPPLFEWALWVPTFAVLVYGLQRVFAPRVTVDDVLAAREQARVAEEGSSHDESGVG